MLDHRRAQRDRGPHRVARAVPRRVVARRRARRLVGPVRPRPGGVWARLIESETIHDDGSRGLSGYYLWEHLWASLWRILNGLAWAIVVGVPLGLLLATVRAVPGRRSSRTSTSSAACRRSPTSAC